MKNGQLSYQDRVKLQSYLEDEIPVKVICKKLDVSKQSIYREIKRNGILKENKLSSVFYCAPYCSSTKSRTNKIY